MLLAFISLYSSSVQGIEIVKILRRQALCPTQCPFLATFEACGTNVMCLCTVLNGAGSTINACITCIQSADAALGQQFATAVQECAALYPSSSGTLPSTIAAPTTLMSIVAPTAVASCSGVCALILQATTCTADSCACPAYLSAGADCIRCTGTANATASSIISQSIAFCFSQLLSSSGLATTTDTSTPTSATMVPCASQCAPLSQVQTCTDIACACPAYLIAGDACLACTGTANATASSSISQSLSSCSALANSQTGTALPTGLPCASQCSDIINLPQTCTNELCSCTGYVKQGPSCYSCTAPFNATAASILTKDISICLSNYPAFGTVAPTAPPCFTPCAFTQQISAVCGITNDTCFCPTFVLSASACSACFSTVNTTFAMILSEALDICSSKFPALFSLSTSSSSQASARPTAAVTRTSTVLISGCGEVVLLGGFESHLVVCFALLVGLVAVVL